MSLKPVVLRVRDSRLIKLRNMLIDAYYGEISPPPGFRRVIHQARRFATHAGWRVSNVLEILSWVSGEVETDRQNRLTVLRLQGVGDISLPRVRLGSRQVSVKSVRVRLHDGLVVITRRYTPASRPSPHTPGAGTSQVSPSLPAGVPDPARGDISLGG